MNVSDFIQSHRADPSEGVSPQQVLARAAAVAEDAPLSLAEQAEENAVRCLTAGYQPGTVAALAQKIAETEQALQAARAKVEAGQRYMAAVMRQHELGQITALDVARASDGDQGDEGLVTRLSERLEGLQRAQAAAIQAAPSARPDTPLDPLQAAQRAAHQAFVEVTRERMRNGLPQQAARLFAVCAAAPGECAECVAVTADDAERARLHEAVHGGHWPGHEITRTTPDTFALAK